MLCLLQESAAVLTYCWVLLYVHGKCMGGWPVFAASVAKNVGDPWRARMAKTSSRLFKYHLGDVVKLAGRIVRPGKKTRTRLDGTCLHHAPALSATPASHSSATTASPTVASSASPRAAA